MRSALMPELRTAASRVGRLEAGYGRYRFSAVEAGLISSLDFLSILPPDSIRRASKCLLRL